jgi:hypothetical protein
MKQGQEQQAGSSQEVTMEAREMGLACRVSMLSVVFIQSFSSSVFYVMS